MIFITSMLQTTVNIMVNALYLCTGPKAEG
mgnify:CR=1 FL=1|jgi:hypothetical protein